MKRTVSLAIVVAAMLVSCGKDKIETLSGSSATDPAESYEDVSFDRTVGIVFSATGAATVSGIGSGDSIEATVNGNGVTIVNSGTAKVQYTLSGSTSNGYLKIYSAKKQALLLDGVSLANSDGAAINVQGPQASPNSGKATYVVVEGTNTLADGGTYSRTPSTEDEKAALFSEGQIIISGSGSLTVTATGKAGITSDDYLKIADGTVQLAVSSTAGHGLRGKDSVPVCGGTTTVNVSANGKKGISTDGPCRISGGSTTVQTSGNTVVESGDTSKVACLKCDGDFSITAGSLTLAATGIGAKGLSADGTGTFSGGTVSVSATGSNFGTSGGGGGGHWGPQSSSNSVASKGIKCEGNITVDGGTVMVTQATHEGIETKGALTVSGGHVYSYSTGDDAINSAGKMLISGGYVCGWSDKNDGLDANADFTIQGGVVYAICTCGGAEVALDAMEQCTLSIAGGTLVAIGSLERGASMTQACYSTSSVSASTWYTMTVGNTSYAFKTPTGGSPLVVSGSSKPTVMKGGTYSGGTEYFGGIMVSGATVSGGTEVQLSTYSNSGGGHGPGGW